MTRFSRWLLPLAAAFVFIPHAAFAQVGTIAGVVRDTSGAVLPGVTVEVTSPALIERVRSTATDGNGRYQIAALPVGTYRVTFSLSGFASVVRENIPVTSDAATNVPAEMQVGGLAEEVTVIAEAPTVDVLNARVQHVLAGDDIGELPTQRDIPSLLNLVPGLQASALRGTCTGGVGGFCNPTVPLFNAHVAAGDTDGQNQGRIMVDGMVLNMGRSGAGINENVGQANGLVLNTADAQEVSITLSGALGESETGGAAINLIPRTGGNTFSGSHATTYTQTRFFDRNTKTRLTWSPNTGPRTQLPRNNFNYDYDVTGAFGGPVVRDRLWFYLQGRIQNRQWYPGGGQQPGFTNRNEGLWGANYLPQRNCNAPRSCDEAGWLTYTNEYKNASLRLTAQASPRNKFNLYWDEQDACTNPCYGMISIINSPEAYFTLQNRPNRLMQVSWTNPYSNRILLEAGLSTVLTHQDQTKSREFSNPGAIPRICESGTTVGRDDVSMVVNTQVWGSTNPVTGPFGGAAGSCQIFSTMNSGSINGPFPGNSPNAPNAVQNDDTYRTRASLSYITGSHNLKVGWDGAYFMEKVRNDPNGPRMAYHYHTPIAQNAAGVLTPWNEANRTGDCRTAPAHEIFPCGNFALGIAQGWHDPNDQANTNLLRPRPIGFAMNTGPGETDERVWFGAIFVQDQWTINRVTLNGAFRYDRAKSRYGTSCIGPDVFVAERWCTEPQDGVSYHDATARWGVAWDLFGTGKTALKWNMGKYLQAAGFGGLYTNFNDARRSTNEITRRWDDLNGDRIVQCDHSNFQQHTVPGGDFCGPLTQMGGGASNAFLSFGQPPSEAQLLNPNSSCGLKNSPAHHVAYCQEAGQDLMQGWGTRRNEWQFGLGIQHELLPRVSAEFTYNMRRYGNLTTADTVNRGCDYFGPLAETMPYTLCAEEWQQYRDPSALYDFYSITVPQDSRLPNGGGYTIRGNINQRLSGALPPAGGNVTLIRDDLSYYWHGFDTNFVFRARGGLRMSGGTSTGGARRNQCYNDIDTPNVKGRVGNRPNCLQHERFRTNVRANASYTIPWVDVLSGLVVQYRPGNARTATLAVSYQDVEWEPESAHRAGTLFNTPTGTTETQNVNLLDFHDQFGEGLTQVDLTLRKNFRFGGRRISAGVDVYNLMNTDAATGYQNTYTAMRLDNGVLVSDPMNDWNRVTAVTAARFARLSLSVQF